MSVESNYASQRRSLKEFPPSLQHAIEISTFEKEPRPVGSSALRIHPYFADVDVFERTVGCCSEEYAAHYFADRLQEVGRRIAISPGVWFKELKAGVDRRYLVPSLGSYAISQVTDLKEDSETQFNAQQLLIDLNRLFDEGLLTAKEYKELEVWIHELQDEKIEILMWDHVPDILREKAVLRWSLPELLDGEKKLSGQDQIVTLEEALLDHGRVKLDMLTFAENRLVEVETLYDLFYRTSKNPRAPIKKLSLTLGNYTENIAADLDKYSSQQNWNPLKYSKRAWALANVLHRNDITKALTPLFTAPVSGVNQIMNDIILVQETIVSIPDVPLDQLTSVIAAVPKRLSNITRERFFEIANHATEDFFDEVYGNSSSPRPLTFKQREEAAAKLDVLVDRLREFVNENASAFIQPLQKSLSALADQAKRKESQANIKRK
jgi:hypothetical protein